MEPTAVTDDRVSVGALTGLLRLLGIGKATDAESESVKKNEEVNTEALKRAKSRNEDEKPEEEKMDKTKDELEREEKKKATDSALVAAVTKLTDVVAALDKKMSKDDDEEEKEEKEEKKPFAKDKKKSKDKEEEGEEYEEEKHEEEDSDLIAVETLSKEDRPKNPIPGADKALDALRALKPFIAQSKDKALKLKFNDAVLAVKSGGTADYASLLSTVKPEEVKNSENKSRVLNMPASDSAANGDFVAQASKFHRRNVGEAAAERRTAGKE